MGHACRATINLSTLPLYLLLDAPYAKPVLFIFVLTKLFFIHVVNDLVDYNPPLASAKILTLHIVKNSLLANEELTIIESFMSWYCLNLSFRDVNGMLDYAQTREAYGLIVNHVNKMIQ